ncbi:MAG: Ribosomal RNA adenine methylase transferase [uncultured bacterium]|nr:MAG: Ribosomal RNA adenine methylase transferase [uncultured bacterium]OGT59039.1 MAG: hypothetical protein A3F43_06650 [Gammaproteobacteria bacterium RIFCSPHIGHO2_12_FULL_42_10]
MINKDLFAFLKVLASNPRTMGAILPSSKQLAKEMVTHVTRNLNNVIVELGAGTGVITERLIQSGIHPSQIIVIECAPELAKQLQERFPTVKIITGDAMNLANLLAYEKRTINTIISSLPLRSLPKTTTQSILKQIKKMLPKEGRYIQYTYSFMRNPFYALRNYELIASKRIWMNLPPARVDVWASLLAKQ